ncbi:MAG: hypothetical protein ACK2U1_13170, partial [Anaerolineales bacterium]
PRPVFSSMSMPLPDVSAFSALGGGLVLGVFEIGFTPFSNTPDFDKGYTKISRRIRSKNERMA